MTELNFTTSRSTIVMAGLLVLSSASQTLASEYTCKSYYNEFSGHSGSGITVTKGSKNTCYSEEQAVNPAEFKLALSECPAFIKQSFGLNVTDVSKILSISRPTAYKYLDGDIPSGENAELIEKLYNLALVWNREAKGAALGMEFKRNYNGHSLYNLLVEKQFDGAEQLVVDIAKVVVSRQARVKSTGEISMNNHFSPDMVRKTIG